MVCILSKKQERRGKRKKNNQINSLEIVNDNSVNCTFDLLRIEFNWCSFCFRCHSHFYLFSLRAHIQNSDSFWTFSQCYYAIFWATEHTHTPHTQGNSKKIYKQTQIFFLSSFVFHRPIQCQNFVGIIWIIFRIGFEFETINAYNLVFGQSARYITSKVL